LTGSKPHSTIVADFSRVWSAVSRSHDAKGAIQLGFAGVFMPLGGFVMNVVFARTLGASGRGDLAAVVAALGVCEAGLTFGLPDVLARHIARGSLPPGAQRSLATGAIAASLIPGVLILLFCHSRNFSWPVAGVAGLVVPLVTATGVGYGVLLGRRAYRRLSVSLILVGSLKIAAPGLLMLVNNPNKNLALLLVLGWTVSAAVPIFASRPFAGPLSSPRDAWQILREALGVWPMNLAWQLNLRLDQLVLAMFVSAADLGRYAVCVGIAEVPAVLAHGPRDVVLARAAKGHTFKGVPRITLAIIVTGVISGVLSAFFAAPLLAAVFGPTFRSGSLALGILLAATGFTIGAGLLARCLIAIGRGRSATMSQVVGLCVTVVILPVAVSFGGGITSAAAVSLASSTSAYLLALSRLRCFSQPESAAH
jgi:O-antigen/teichoic acid export membrane protein